MNIFERDKTRRIQDYLVELYSLKLQDGEFNAEARKMFAEKSFANWVSSLQGYSEEQIKEAINWYHKNKNNRTAILNKDYVEIARQWDFGFKSGLKGIVKRRVDELYLYMSDV